MHTAWPGDVHTLLLGAGSFVALMVVYAHTLLPGSFAWPGDAHTLLLGAGSFVALMVVDSCTPTWPGDVHTLLLGAGSFVALMVVYAHHMAG